MEHDESIHEICVTPPPWELGENENLDGNYYKFMLELQKTQWKIEITREYKRRIDGEKDGKKDS